MDKLNLATRFAELGKTVSKQTPSFVENFNRSIYRFWLSVDGLGISNEPSSLFTNELGFITAQWTGNGVLTLRLLNNLVIKAGFTSQEAFDYDCIRSIPSAKLMAIRKRAKT